MRMFTTNDTWKEKFVSYFIFEPELQCVFISPKKFTTVSQLAIHIS